MAWRRPGDKPLSERMMASLLTHICAMWPQLVKENISNAAPVLIEYLNLFITAYTDVPVTSQHQ